MFQRESVIQAFVYMASELLVIDPRALSVLGKYTVISFSHRFVKLNIVSGFFTNFMNSK